MSAQFTNVAEADHIEFWYEDGAISMYMVLTDKESHYTQGTGGKGTMSNEFLAPDGKFFYDEWSNLVGAFDITYAAVREENDLIVDFLAGNIRVGQYKCGKFDNMPAKVDIKGGCIFGAWDGVSERKTGPLSKAKAKGN